MEVDGETLEIPFQALEIVAVSGWREQSMYTLEKMSKLIKGRDTWGWGKLLEILKKKDQLGLGYKPANEGVQKTNLKKFCTL